MSADSSNEQVALVTGAGQGIGAAIAETLAEEGYNVAVNDIDGRNAQATADRIERPSIDTLSVEADVSSPEDVDKMVTEVLDIFDRIDVLVNNAGIETNTPFLELEEEEWDQVLGTNLKGVFLLTQRVATEMVRRNIEGTVVNITSIHQDVPRTNKLHYDSSKAGLWMLTKDVALELSEHRINVNAVAPGAIATQMNQEALEDEEVRAEINAATPWDRLGEPKEVAEAVSFLVSDKAEYITGSYLRVDGGRSLR